MNKHVLIVASAAMALLLLIACSTPIGDSLVDSQKQEKAVALSETLVDELVANLTSNQKSLLQSNFKAVVTVARSVSVTDIVALKAAALDRIAADGLTESNKVDLILASILRGVQKGIENTPSLANNPDIAATIIKQATASVIGSMATKDRVAMLSDGANSATASAALTKVAVSVIIAVVPDSAAVNTAIAETLKAAMAELNSVDQSVVSSASTSEALGDMVTAATQVIMDNQSNLKIDVTTSLKSLTAAAMESISESTKVSAADKQAVVSIAVQAIVTVMVAETDTSSGTTSSVYDIVASATETMAQESIEVDSSKLSAAVDKAVDDGNQANTKVADVVVSTTEITKVISELPPTVGAVNASATSVTAENTEVTLTGSGTPASGVAGVTYQWKQVGGPVGFGQATESASGTYKFTPAVSGTYQFQLVVTNAPGMKSAQSSVVSVVASFVSTSESQGVARGINDMKNRRWDDALTEFARVLVINPNNEAALMWKSLLDLASVSVDPKTVELAQNRIGLVDYPSSMSALFAGTWLNSNFYYPQVAQDGSYLSILDYAHPAILPRVQVPAWASPIVEQGSTVQYNADSDHIVVWAYPYVLLTNLIERNPVGLDDALDLVLAGAFGSRLDSALNEVASLPEGATVTVPNDLIYAFGGYATSGMPGDSSFKITKSMLQLSGAGVLFYKSQFQLLASYKLSYPVKSAFGFDWSTVTSSTNFLDYVVANVPNPIKAGLLTERSASTRTAAKNTMLQGIGLAKSAMTALKTMDVKTWVADAMGPTAVAANSATLDQNTTMVQDNARVVADKALDVLSFVESAITSEGSIYMVQTTSSITSGSSTTFYTTTTYAGTEPAADPDVTFMEFKPGVVYSTDIFDPAKLLETSANGGAQLYAVDTAALVNGAQFPLSATKALTAADNILLYDDDSDNSTPDKPFNYLAFRVNTGRINLLYPAFNNWAGSNAVMMPASGNLSLTATDTLDDFNQKFVTWTMAIPTN